MATDSSYTVGLTGAPSGGATGTNIIRSTQLKSLACSITEPAGMDLTREGKRFALCIVGAITGIAPIQTLGAQVAAFSFTNTSSTATMFFQELGMVLESGTAGTTGNCVYACHFTLPTSTGTYAGTTVVNLNGGTTASTTLACEADTTVTTPAAVGWFPVAWDSQVASAIGSCSLVNQHVNGKLALQPGKSLGLCTVGATGSTPLFAPYASWTEEASTCG